MTKEFKRVKYRKSNLMVPQTTSSFLQLQMRIAKLELNPSMKAQLLELRSIRKNKIKRRKDQSLPNV